MTEVTHEISGPPYAPMSVGALARAANGAALRWTPGPDELRLPSCDDQPVPHNTRQSVAIVDCFDSLQRHWRGRLDVFVGTDQFLYWDQAYDARAKRGNPPTAPDVYVAFGVANRHRNSYVAWEEGKPPDFVLEVVSPSSRRRDADEKPGIYAKIGVPEFFLYDPEGKLEPALSGFELCGGAYQPLPQERFPQGAVGVRSKMLRLCLCIKPPGPEPLDGSLCWYDPAAGGFLPTRLELADAKLRLANDNRRLTDDNHRLTDDNRRLADGKRQAEAKAEASEARVAELEALVEQMQRG